MKPSSSSQDESMKTSNEPDDVVMTSTKNVTEPKIRGILKLGGIIKKKKSFVQFDLLSPKSTKRRLPTKNEIKPSPCKRDQVVSCDPTTDLPTSLFIMYCDRCQSYSHTGRHHWVKMPSEYFLVSRIKFHIYRLRLKLIKSWIVQPGPGHNSNSTIMLGLRLQFQAPSGDWHEKICQVEYIIAKQICSNCSHLIDETHLSSVVQLRQYATSHRTLRLLEISVMRNPESSFNIQKVKHTEHGVDFFFSNDRDAKALSRFLKSQGPVKCEQIHKNIQPSDCSSNNGSSINCQCVITALICPILQHDLIYLPRMVSATLGLQDMGPLVVCLNIDSTISLVDPLNLNHCVINRNDYWKNPFKSLKSGRDLVEYIVVDVKIVRRKGRYTFVDVQVAQDSDYGKNGRTMLARTHLGQVLKPGDHAFGYDLHGLNTSGLNLETIKHMLPNVVLIRKKWLATKQPCGSTREKKSLEYEQFLRDLESNPEALFNLSLNGGDGEKQNSELSSEKPENVGLELEDLLADLALNDQEKRVTYL